MSSWRSLPHLTNDDISVFIDKLRDKMITPYELFETIQTIDKYINIEELHHIQKECSHLYPTWYLYEHALCSRVSDRWNLREKYGVEGYYYLSYEDAEYLETPVDKWFPITNL